MQPQVRELNNIIAELGQGVAGQKAQIDSDILRSEQSGAAQQEGLAAVQNKAFGQIEQGASNKGMLFSGFSPDAQAEYTSSTYLPALAKLQEAIASTRANLLGKKTDLDADVYARAVGIREGDVNAKRTWDMSVEERRAAAEEAERNRQFQATENAKQIAAENSRAAASRAASAGPNVAAITANVDSFLKSKVGKDGKVSPASFQQARSQWVGAGGNPDAFAQAFYGYVNRSHIDDYF